jgi:hypothetical protein
MRFRNEERFEATQAEMDVLWDEAEMEIERIRRLSQSIDRDLQSFADESAERRNEGQFFKTLYDGGGSVDKGKGGKIRARSVQSRMEMKEDQNESSLRPEQRVLPQNFKRVRMEEAEENRRQRSRGRVGNGAARWSDHVRVGLWITILSSVLALGLWWVDKHMVISDGMM